MSGYGGNHHLKAGGESQNTDVDTAAEALASSTLATAVELKALPGNTAVVYYRTNGTASTTTGFPLSAGESTGWMPVPGNDLANISVIGASANQGIAYRWLV